MERLTEALDDLQDAEKDAALAMAESNRKLQEAREIAGDANVPIKERIAALKEAGRIEKEELDKVVKMNQLKAQLTMESIAMELGARQGLIDMIKSGSLEQLKAARAELASLKNVDKEKLYAIDQMIIAAEDAGAKSAKVGKKTQSAITSLEKEEEGKREAERKAASDRAKAARDKVNEERFQQEKAAQDQLKKIITEGERAIQDALKVLRFANRETELKELNAKYQADLAAAQAAGFGTLKITEAYQKQREEINKNYDAKDATAKSEKEKADEEKTLANQQKVLGGLTNYYAKDFALKEDNRKKDEEINKLRLAQQIEQAEAIQGILQNATTVFGKQTAVGKGIAIAEATISTYLGAAKALSGIQKGNPIGAVLAIAQAAAIVANGIKTVKSNYSRSSTRWRRCRWRRCRWFCSIYFSPTCITTGSNHNFKPRAN